MANSLRKKTSDEKALRFARAFFLSDNATDAAIAIGHEKKSAHMLGARLKKDKRVLLEIQRLRAIEENKTLFTKDQIINELVRCAFGTLDKVAKWGVKGLEFIDSNTLDEDALAIIEEVSVGEKTKKIKKADKLKALELLGKELGMFQTNAVGTKNNPIHVNNIAEKSDEELLAVINRPKSYASD